jgi:Kef-type K+ transport system membrane component KefB
LRKVQGGRALFVLLLCAIMSEVGGRLALDPLIVALSAGLFVENVTRTGASELVHDIESASLPVYVVFFALAGALLDLATLRSVAVPAVVLVFARALGMFLGARIAAKRSDAEPAVARWTFVGLLPQAGLALALALMIPKVFPSLGAGASALIVGIVGMNELVMPVVLRWGLIRAGEARPSPPPEPGTARAAPSH